MYFDAYAVIVQRDLDGGDSLHREATYAFGKKLIYDINSNQAFISPSAPDLINEVRRPANAESPFLERDLGIFEVEPGIYVRHPDPGKWYSNPATTSRDQLIPVIAYCAAYEDYPRLWRLFLSTLRRGMFAQNTARIGDDNPSLKLPDPMHLNMAHFIRAGGWWTAPLYPALWVFDTVDLVGTVLTALPIHFQDDHLIPRWKEDDDVDDSNTVVLHLLSALYKPTLISELNRYIYSTTRPKNRGNQVYNEVNPVMGALRWYYRDDHGGISNPEIAELYRPLIERYFTYRTPGEIFASFWQSEDWTPTDRLLSLR